MEDDFSVERQLDYLKDADLLQDFLFDYQEYVSTDNIKQYASQSENLSPYNIIPMAIKYTEFWCEVANEMEFDLMHSTNWTHMELNKRVQKLKQHYPEALL